MIWLRLLHIVGGSVWVGAAVIMAFFLLPTARKGGPEGARFVGQVMQRMGPGFGIMMLLTVVPGFIMYWRISGGFDRAWMGSPTGKALGAGAVASLLAIIVGMMINGPTRSRIVALRKTLETQGRAPTATETTQLAHWQLRIERGARAAAALLVVAACAMAIARYV